MILDSLENIEKYRTLNPRIYQGLQHLKTLNTELPLGQYFVNENIKVIISEYATMEKGIDCFEAHKTVIDIQIPIFGTEEIVCILLDNLTESVPYNVETDTTLYKFPESGVKSILR